ncbi:MAG: prolyl oligopeptidase family serine peptidase [Planctomycetota bacterium]|jgi:acetyl esterase/lipase
MKWMVRSLLIITVAVCAAPTFGVEGVEIVPDVVYGHKHGMALTFDVYKPKQQANGTGILFIVSGGWYSNWRPPEQSIGWFKPMLDKGFTVFAVRHGSSPKYVIPEIIEDVRRSVRFIRLRANDFGVAPERLGVAGASAGGHLSLMLGTASDKGNPDAKDEVLRVTDRVAAVVAYFPPTDLRPWVNKAPDFPALNFDESKAADCSPILHVSEDDPPALLIHGDKDELVPIDHSEKILAEFEKHKVISELLVIKGAGHGFRGEDGKRASEAMVAWFEEHLVKH